MLNTRLKTKIYLFFFITLIISTLPMSIVSYIFINQHIYDLHAALLKKQTEYIQYVIEIYSRHQISITPQLIATQTTKLRNNTDKDNYIYIFDQIGNLISDNTNQVILSKYDMQHILRQQSGHIEIKNGNTSYFGYFIYYEPLQWIIFSGQKTEYIFNLNRKYLFFSILTITITLMIIMFIIFIAVKNISKRLQNIWFSIQKIEQGQFGVQIYSSYQGEIGQIVHTFNSISEKLKQHFDLLENKIFQRTTALTEINQRLEQKIEEHQRIEAEVIQTNKKLKQEIHERKRTEQALRYTYQKLLSFTQEIPMAYIEWNRDLMISTWNPAAEIIFVYSPQQAMQMKITSLVEEKNRELLLNTIKKLQQSKIAIRQTLNCSSQDGREIICTWYNIPLCDEYGEVIQWLSLVQDVTEQKLNEEEVILQKEALQITLEHLENTQEELIQIEKMAALGQVIAGVAHEINTPLGAIRSAIGNISDFLRHDLKELPNFFNNLSKERQADFFHLLDNATQYDFILSSKEKRKIKKSLTQKLIKHDIEKPESIASKLVNIGIYDDILPFLPLLYSKERESILKQAYLLTSLQRSAYAIATASERAGRIVFALKSYARYEQSSEKTQANVVDGIETVLTLYHNQIKQGVEVVRNYGDIPKIWCYPDELNQLWSNLIHNALQAMEYRGKLILTTSTDDKSVYVKVTDTGKGIPDGIKYKIFQPFFTTKPAGEGSGMGLGIVKKIVEKHAGNVTVESRAGLTSFIITLPIKKL